jgi:glycosyltransferase involved in cell wall biosynthesis
VQTVHHLPQPSEVALWVAQCPTASFIAVSREQARVLAPLHVAGIVPHAVDLGAAAFRLQPEDYLLFLGRFTEGKGVLEAIEIARRTGHRLVLAAKANDYYHQVVAPHVDGQRVEYIGEVDAAAKTAIVGGARALVYPVLAGESFGLVLAEAGTCGTPALALRRGAVDEIVEDGVTGIICDSVDEMVEALPRVLALDRVVVRDRAVARFGVERMVDQYAAIYTAIVVESGVGGARAGL